MRLYSLHNRYYYTRGGLGWVQFVVVVGRGGGVLGLTLQGSEDPVTGLRVAALTEGESLV